jgi:hypothetical protein
VCHRRYASLYAMMVILTVTSGCVWIEPGSPNPVPGYGRIYEINGAPVHCVAERRVLVASMESSTVCLVKVYRVDHQGKVDLPLLENRRLSGTWAMFPMLVDCVFIYKGRWVTPDRTLISPLVPGYVPVGSSGLPRRMAWLSWDEEQWMRESDDPKRHVVMLRRATCLEERSYLLGLAKVGLGTEDLDAKSRGCAKEAQAYARKRIRAIERQMKEKEGL